MSFGDKRLDNALDKFLTKTPEEYHHLIECEKCGKWHNKFESHKCIGEVGWITKDAITKDVNVCTVVKCNAKRQEGDRYFCSKHRVLWKNFVYPFGLIPEHITLNMLHKFQDEIR